MSSSPVAVFDSGLGGLTVAREIRAFLPAEELVYLGDGAYCPYGGRPLEWIRDRSVAIGRFLAGEGAKALVVACNTASGAALEALRETLSIPVVGMEPALKPAATESRTGKVGVMATEGTLRSERFARLVSEHGEGVEVVAQACPGLVELVEEGRFEGPEVRRALEGLLEPLCAAGVDTVVLGCTHYPFLSEVISEVLGPRVRLVDSSPAIARQTRRVLEERGELAEGGAGGVRILTTGDPAEVRPIVERLWRESVEVEGVEV